MKPKIGSFGDNGLKDDANTPLPKTNGLVRTPEQQMELAAKMLGKGAKAALPQTSPKNAQPQSKMEQDAKNVKPASGQPQTFDTARLDNLLNDFDNILADVQRDNNTPNTARQTLRIPPDPTSQPEKTDAKARPVPPPKPQKFQSSAVTKSNSSNSPAVSSSRLVAESVQASLVIKPASNTIGVQREKPVQSHVHGSKK